MIEVSDPKIIKQILPENEFTKLKSNAQALYQNKQNYESGFGRYTFGPDEILKNIHIFLLDKAKEIFKSDTLMPSWCMMAAYEGNQGSLFKHKDDNACTYHFDIAIWQTKTWDIWVNHNNEDKSYTLYENDALAMYGEDQEHWRDPFIGEDSDIVFNAFLFYCEPDHWFFTHGPEYIETIRQNK